jgi:hypothetical protein
MIYKTLHRGQTIHWPKEKEQTMIYKTLHRGQTIHWPKETGQTMIYKTLQRKLKNKKHELH